MTRRTFEIEMLKQLPPPLTYEAGPESWPYRCTIDGCMRGHLYYLPCRACGAKPQTWCGDEVGHKPCFDRVMDWLNLGAPHLLKEPEPFLVLMARAAHE